MKKFKIPQELPKCYTETQRKKILLEKQRHGVSKCFWQNGANRLAGLRAATNLQFVKNTVSAKHCKVKHNEIRYAHIPCSQEGRFNIAKMSILPILFRDNIISIIFQQALFCVRGN